MTQQSRSLDRIDAKIIKLLQRDGRISWSRLGRKVNLSASAAQRRVESLVARGVIHNFTINVNESALGNTVKAFVAVNVERKSTDEAEAFRRRVRVLPQVLACHMVSGSIDFILEIVAKDLNEFGRFIDSELLNLPAVKDASSSFVLQVVKSKEIVTDH
ncbi:MAG TPA: Lrp/AsnC family transcriptional regulator [Woeseiaceae bacterium]|nr:Lrp/AsnC family transcriptional regulator [Woeseiaceae bacterium]